MTTIKLRYLDEVKELLLQSPQEATDPAVEKLFSGEVFKEVKGRKRRHSEVGDPVNDACVDVEMSLEECGDLATAWRTVQHQGREVRVTRESARNILALLAGERVDDIDMVNYFVFDHVLKYLETVNNDDVLYSLALPQLQEVFQLNPALAEPFLTRLALLPGLPATACSLLRSCSPILPKPAPQRLLLSWLAAGQLAPSSLPVADTLLSLQPLQSPEVQEALCRAVSTAPAEADSCIRWAKWVLRVMTGPVLGGRGCRDEVLVQLRKRLGGNRTFLRGKLAALGKQLAE